MKKLDNRDSFHIIEHMPGLNRLRFTSGRKLTFVSTSEYGVTFSLHYPHPSPNPKPNIHPRRCNVVRRLAIIAGLLAVLVLPVSSQEIFKAKWKGTGIQAFSGTSSVTQFRAYYVADGLGYVYLKAYTGTDSGDIIRTRWQGVAVQGFAPGSGAIVGFETSGPDFEGYVTLTAVGSGGQKGEILKTRWAGNAVQGFSAPAGEAINGFTATGPDAQGYMTLGVVTGPVGIGEKQYDESRTTPLVFALNPITPNPSFGPARISYSIPKPTLVNLFVYDCTGRMVKTLVAGVKTPGRYSLVWQGTDDQGRKVGTGIYFVKMNAGEFKAVKKMIVVK